MATLRLGLIGAGTAARDVHAPALRELKDRFEIVGVASRTAEKAKAVAALHGSDIPVYTDYRRMLQRGDVDAVVVAVPIELNLAIARDCVAAAKHVMLEKPIAANLAEAEEVLGLAGRGVVTFFVAEEVRYWPDLHLARRIFEAGTIGRLGLLSWQGISFIAKDSPYLQAEWRRNPKHIGGFLSDGGVHIAAGVQFLAGRVASVQAVSTVIQPYLGESDTILLTLRFRNGALGQVTLCYGGLDHEAGRPRLYGDKGTIVSDRDRVQVWLHSGEKRVLPVEGPRDCAAEFTAFHAAVERGDTSSTFAREALEDLRLIEAATRSARTGDVVYL